MPATRLREVPFYLLTSAATFSAAEGFAYELQARGRARVVGETTRGGANPGGYEPAGERFEIFVPDVLVRSAATGSNWEGAGSGPTTRSPPQMHSRPRTVRPSSSSVGEAPIRCSGRTSLGRSRRSTPPAPAPSP